MTCRQLVGLTSRYLEAAASEVDRVRLELHLLRCPDCVQYLDNVRRTVRALRALGLGAAVPADRRRALVEAFAPARQGADRTAP